MATIPAPFTTYDGTLKGAVDGSNLQFSFNPYPATLLYATTGVTNSLVFLNGLLIDEYDDYTAGPGYFALVSSLGSDTLTARLYQGGGATKMRLSEGGLTAVGSLSLRISPQGNPGQAPTRALMLLRNGQLLTSGPDYTMVGPWIALVSGQAIQAGDTFTALIGMGGSSASTYDSSITGAIDGTNATFVLPFSPTETMLFRNGQLLTEGFDYTQIGATVVLLSDQIPQTGDTLTAQIFRSGGPVQVTTAAGTLYYATAAQSLLFRNGLLMTQPLDGLTAGDLATFVAGQVPQLTDVVTVQAWVRDVTDPAAPAFNLSTQFSSNDGSIVGVLNGANNVFTLNTTALVTQIWVAWNGDSMTEGVDYAWATSQPSSTGQWVSVITMMAGQYPQSGDVLTAQVWGD